MLPTRQEAYSFPPRVFRYSLDWRFLLPLTDTKKICLLLEDQPEFSQALAQVGIDASQQLSFSDFKNRDRTNFPFLVMPFGLPVGWVDARSADRVEFYSVLRRFIESGGYLLVGFNNRLSWRVRETTYYSSTPRRAMKELIQAGFKAVEIFGAMPNLQIPEYIFELEPQTMRFALQNRFRRKPAVLRALRVLDGIIGWKRISHFLPCYFAVATA